MDFAWTPEQDELYERILEFGRRRFGASRPAEATFTREEWAVCGGFGLLGLCAPESYGGLGLDALTTARALEAFGRGCPDAGLAFSIAAHLFACVMPIAEHGGEELRRRALPRLCGGEWIGANAITEPEAGSDAFSLRARATRDGDDYLLSGTKAYVTNGPAADLVVVYAATNPKFGYLGLSAFAVGLPRAGVTAGPAEPKLGLRGSPLGELHFDDCRVPDGARLGREGQGGAVFQASMGWERACLFALYLGAMERQLDAAVAHARDRQQFGRAIGKNQAVSHRLAEMRLRLEGARLLLYRACWLKSRGEDAALATALAKLAVSEAAVHNGLDAIRTFGGVGVMSAAGVDRGLRDALPGTIFSGTSDIQRDVIARYLGL